MVVVMACLLLTPPRTLDFRKDHLSQHGKEDGAKNRQRNKTTVDVPGQLSVCGFGSEKDEHPN
jgi:hypothetical protein